LDQIYRQENINQLNGERFLPGRQKKTNFLSEISRIQQDGSQFLHGLWNSDETGNAEYLDATKSCDFDFGWNIVSENNQRWEKILAAEAYIRTYMNTVAGVPYPRGLYFLASHVTHRNN
jgi:hypothetical protein